MSLPRKQGSLSASREHRQNRAKRHRVNGDRQSRLLNTSNVSFAFFCQSEDDNDTSTNMSSILEWLTLVAAHVEATYDDREATGMHLPQRKTRRYAVIFSIK